MSDLLDGRKQRVLLYWQICSRRNFKSGVLQYSVLVPQQFFIYMNYLSDALFSKVELFTGDTSLLCVTHDFSFFFKFTKQWSKKSKYYFYVKCASTQKQMNKFKKQFSLWNWIDWHILLKNTFSYLEVGLESVQLSHSKRELHFLTPEIRM